MVPFSWVDAYNRSTTGKLIICHFSINVHFITVVLLVIYKNHENCIYFQWIYEEQGILKYDSIEKINPYVNMKGLPLWQRIILEQMYTVTIQNWQSNKEVRSWQDIHCRLLLPFWPQRRQYRESGRGSCRFWPRHHCNLRVRRLGPSFLSYPRGRHRCH